MRAHWCGSLDNNSNIDCKERDPEGDDKIVILVQKYFGVEEDKSKLDALHSRIWSDMNYDQKTDFFLLVRLQSSDQSIDYLEYCKEKISRESIDKYSQLKYIESIIEDKEKEKDRLFYEIMIHNPTSQLGCEYLLKFMLTACGEGFMEEEDTYVLIQKILLFFMSSQGCAVSKTEHADLGGVQGNPNGRSRSGDRYDDLTVPY